MSLIDNRAFSFYAYGGTTFPFFNTYSREFSMFNILFLMCTVDYEIVGFPT